jgi:predicted RNA binding protein YcfA (HicA-like mRNA interferase family)
MKACSGKDLIKFLEAHGWQVVRIKGSHHILKKEDCESLLTVPCHGNKDLPKGILNSLLKDAGLKG